MSNGASVLLQLLLIFSIGKTSFCLNFVVEALLATTQINAFSSMD